MLISELLEGFGDDDRDAAKNEKHMSKSIIVTSDGEAQGALAFSYKFRRTVEYPPTDPNVKQRPKRGVNGFARPFVEGSGEGLSSGLMSVLGTVFFYDDDTPDDDNEDEYS